MEIINKFVEITKRDFCFLNEDLKCMRNTFKECELIERDGCVAAIQCFGNIKYLYFFAVFAKNAGRGKQFMLELIDEYKPDIFSAVTCHPAVVKIFDRIVKEKGYEYSIEADVINEIVQKLEEEAEETINFFTAKDNIILKNFYGIDIPQRDRNFIIPKYLQPGDAVLLVIKKN